MTGKSVDRRDQLLTAIHCKVDRHKVPMSVEILHDKRVQSENDRKRQSMPVLEAIDNSQRNCSRNLGQKMPREVFHLEDKFRH